MFFVVFATDKPGMLEVRQQVRARHRVYLRDHNHPVVVRVGGPTFESDAERMNGTMLVIEAENIEQVEEYLNGDPYAEAELFQSVEIRPWSWGLGMPES